MAAPAKETGRRDVTGRRNQYLDAMDLPVWVARDAPRAPGAVGDEAEIADEAEVAAESRAEPPDAPRACTADWDELETLVRSCTLCELHTTRTQAVVGVGNRNAELLVVGEAPGQEEDRQGEPFVGRAGQLLNAMLRAIGLSREEVYIANVLKCRPPNNRDPKPQEAQMCAPYLDRQIELLRPRAILVLGRIAAQRLLRSDAPVGRLRGQRSELPDRGIPLVVSYHPAYLLRSPAAKAKAWHDLCLVRELLRPAS